MGERLSLSTKRRSLFIQIDPCADGIREIIFPSDFCDGQRFFVRLYSLFKASGICIRSGERVEQSALFPARDSASLLRQPHSLSSVLRSPFAAAGGVNPREAHHAGDRVRRGPSWADG